MEDGKCEDGKMGRENGEGEEGRVKSEEGRVRGRVKGTVKEK